MPFRLLLILLLALGLTAMLLGGCGDSDPTGPVARVKATDPLEVRR